MRVVDKYELAKCPYGTPFYHLECCDADNEYFQITEGLKILTSHISYTYIDDKPFFNGVCTLEPDLYDEENCCGIFTKDIVEKVKFELFELLNKIKNMEAGMSSKIHDSIYLRYKGKPYAIHLIELEDAEVTENDRKKYLNCDDTYIKDMKNIASMETFLRD